MKILHTKHICGTARHSNKMMKRATIAGLFYQATQIAAILLISGVAGIRSLSARTMKRDLAPVTAQTEKDEIGSPAY